MRRILLVLESEELLSALQFSLQTDYYVYACSPAEIRTELLCRYYDALILDLYLTDTDGLTLLKNIQDCRPPVVLMLTPFISQYITQSAAELGAGFIVRIPCSVLSIIHHLKEMLNHLSVLQSSDAEGIIHVHLKKLGIPQKLDGFQLLQIGIPLYAQNPRQLIVKELYPAIGQIAGCRAESVEHSIRRAITSAWASRDNAIWRIYFPHCKTCPTNKEFISTLAELLK